MKAFVLLFSLLSAAVGAHAQAPAQPGPPGMEVVKYSWSKERIDWESDPFRGTNENFHEMQFRTRAQRRAERAGPAEKKQAEAEAQAASAIVRAHNERPPKPARYAFLYKLSVRNASAKAIKEIDWDYIFTDAATGAEVGRREFTSEDKIAPGKSKELSFLVPTPPAQTISVQSYGSKKEREGLQERIVILRILYDDGTVWQSQ